MPRPPPQKALVFLIFGLRLCRYYITLPQSNQGSQKVRLFRGKTRAWGPKNARPKVQCRNLQESLRYWEFGLANRPFAKNLSI